MIDVSRKQLATAARQRIEAAAQFVQAHGGAFIPRPALAAYLAHVGLECLLKAWLMLKSRADDTHQLRKNLPQHEVDDLFTARGHNLVLLAQKVALRRHLVAERQEALMSGAAWSRLAAPPRPYNIRYGTLSLPHEDAAEEVAIATAILHSIEKVL